MDEVELAAAKYQYEEIEGLLSIFYFSDEWIWDCFLWEFSTAAPHLTGIGLKLFVRLLEAPLFGSLILSHLKKKNKMMEVGSSSLCWQKIAYIEFFYSESIIWVFRNVLLRELNWVDAGC